MTKWLPDIAPTDRVVDVATRSVQTRLDAVRYYLKRSAARPGEPEYVHQLRVWTRRSEAALELYADLFPQRRLIQLRKLLKRIRKAAGRVRDIDVYALRTVPSGSKWPARLVRDRAKAQEKLDELYDRLDRGRKLRRKARRLIDRMRRRQAEDTETLSHRARTALRSLAAGFFESAPGENAVDAQLHEFRIRGKELRYAMELLASAFPPAFRDELYPQISVLQEKLGHINDLFVGRKRLEKRIHVLTNPADLSEYRRRWIAHEEDLIQARNEFQTWWTCSRRDALRARFDELTAPVPCNRPLSGG